MKPNYPHYKVVQRKHQDVWQAFELFYVKSETEQIAISDCVSKMVVDLTAGEIPTLLITVHFPVIEQEPNDAVDEASE